jgi:hypothetical protein
LSLASKPVCTFRFFELSELAVKRRYIDSNACVFFAAVSLSSIVDLSKF